MAKDYRVEGDCKCGYATNTTASCGQKECPRYVNREIEVAGVEMEQKMKEISQAYGLRILASLNKTK